VADARRLVSGVGQTMITLGLVVLLFCAYELWFTGVYTGAQQRALADDLAREWARSVPAAAAPGSTPSAAPPVDVPLGSGWAVLRIPSLGRDWNQVVVEGTTVEDLKRGPGHWPDTPDPGQVGNVVVSGHRTTYGAPFNRLDELDDGDALVLETRDAWYTYRWTETVIVAPTQVEVAYPVPGQRDASPTEALLTLTTCHPEYSAQQRLVVHATLTESLPKASGRTPAALAV
jgi:sortase A